MMDADVNLEEFGNQIESISTVVDNSISDIYAKLSEAISEIKNGAKAADAEKFIKGLMNS